MEPAGQTWIQLGELALALLLSGAIGVERQLRQKAAGLRTYTVVGVGSALFMLVSKYGFDDILRAGTISVDPSRMAAQIVSGLGFIGAGVIFVQRGSVQGLTTAATIWLTAAIGAAAAAGLPVLAVLTTVAYFLVSYVVHPLVHRLTARGTAPSRYRLTHVRRPGVLQEIVDTCARTGFEIRELSVEPGDRKAAALGDGEVPVDVVLTALGDAEPGTLTIELAQLSGVIAVRRLGS
ncbi:MgtC/SapB family protein [Streptomyces sp. NPDC001941]|uniref:MgtC/SapB family protein n=1 Tax=Streptomyces sp. NPDC001941 TaxID=3154659 RepID=UPI00332DD42E